MAVYINRSLLVCICCTLRKQTDSVYFRTVQNTHIVFLRQSFVHSLVNKKL